MTTDELVRLLTTRVQSLESSIQALEMRLLVSSYSSSPDQPSTFDTRPSFAQNIFDILVDNLTLTNNSPSAGNVAWSQCTVTYLGNIYQIAPGNTTGGNMFIIWNVGSLTFSQVNSYTPSTSIFDIATNTGGTADTTWNKLGLSGVTSLNISSVNANTITTGTLSAISISACTINACTITASSFTATTGGSDIITINAAGNVVHVANGSNSSDITSGGVTVTNSSGHTLMLGQSFAIVTGPTQTTLAPTTLKIGGIQVLTGQQTGPGNTTDVTDVAVRFNNLLTALRTHGMIT